MARITTIQEARLQHACVFFFLTAIQLIYNRPLSVRVAAAAVIQQTILTHPVFCMYVWARTAQ